MKNKISFDDFKTEFKSRGMYKITYTSPITKREWWIITNDMQIIDKINYREATKKELEEIKRTIKILSL